MCRAPDPASAPPGPSALRSVVGVAEAMSVLKEIVMHVAVASVLLGTLRKAGIITYVLGHEEDPSCLCI